MYLYIRRSDFRPDRLPERFVTPWMRAYLRPRSVSAVRQAFAAKHQARQRRHDRKLARRGVEEWCEAPASDQ